MVDSLDVSFQHHFQIKSITDTAGNTEDTLSSFNADDSQKTVRIDVEKPTVVSGSIGFSTSDTNNDDYDDSSRLLAKNDETIYLDFETNERIDIDSLTVEINGSPLTSTDITNTDTFGKQWQASFMTGLSSNVDSVSFQIKSITDTAGNTEDTLTSFNADDSQKTVRIDVEKPTVKPGSIRFSTFDTMNDDYDDSSRLLAKNDETIYLDFETNERIDIDSLTVEINGSTLTSTDLTNTDTFGKQWQAAFTPTGLSSNVDSVSFQIKSITDTAGNTEDTLTSFNADDSQKTVRIDVEKPDIGNILIVSSNPNSGFAKAGDNLTLSFTTSEVVRNPLDYLNIQGVGPIDLSTSDNGTNWIAKAQVLDNAIGTPSLSLEVLDQAGNRGSPYIDNFSHITLDTSPPVLTGLSFVSSNLPDNSSIYAKAQDNLTLSFQFRNRFKLLSSALQETTKVCSLRLIQITRVG